MYRPKHTAKVFAVCPIKGTQRSWLYRRGWSPSRIRRGPRTANMYAVCFGAFAVCLGHMANGQNLVVTTAIKNSTNWFSQNPEWQYYSYE